MLSKLVRPAVLLMRGPLRVAVRRSGYLIPPDQYDVPLTPKLQLGYALRVYWEIIPLAICTCISLSVLVASVFWAIAHKVDVTFTSRSRACISRTMDLRNPTVHKAIIINQRYEPWPEMQKVLDKMTFAEKRALVRMESCSHP